MPTTGIHLLSAPSHSNSAPSSVSSKNFSSTFEKATRGSASNSEGDCGNPGRPLSVGLCAVSMLGFLGSKKLEMKRVETNCHNRES
jgi:hypothetical protein